ncbi:hypothetical protein J7E99_38355 [Streptomyces sp. ISL-44]|uniref:hypothetical protein n=1 Tax=Streptomyces sp. ISL-44 TaxID=2819184 RepID=UPI001BED0F54|nr:hypothetical protein [Streptomyces sp. ISL-44]MBT2546373.1 hypothetical protein [Streptomyces sp. ISL-44]
MAARTAHVRHYAEALDDAVACVMSRADVNRLLLTDARIAARITAILGRRIADLEQRIGLRRKLRSGRDHRIEGISVVPQGRLGA